MPAGKLAEAAVAANPAKSDRAIAAEIGVGSNTVRRARQKTTAPSGAVAKRTGKDGKTRKPPKRPQSKAPLPTANPIKETGAFHVELMDA